MAKQREQRKLGPLTGGLIGTGAGWVAGTLLLPQLEVVLATAGTYIGNKLGSNVSNNRLFRAWNSKRLLSRIVKRKMSLDFNGTCLNSSSAVLSAIRESATSLKNSRIKKTINNDSPWVLATDYFGSTSSSTHISNLVSRKQIRVNCPYLFPSALLVLYSLKAKLMHHGLDLIIEHTDLTSKDQMQNLYERSPDFSITADPAYILTNDRTRVKSRFKRVMPIFSQEDVLLSMQEDSSPALSRCKIHFHNESTGELLLRSGPFWGPKGSRSPIATAGDIPPLVHSLEKGQYITTWQPITSLMLNSFDGICVVPGSRYKSHVSLYSVNSWLTQSSRSHLLSFLSLFISEWKYWCLRYNIKALRRHVDLLPQFSDASGWSYLYHWPHGNIRTAD